VKDIFWLTIFGMFVLSVGNAQSLQTGATTSISPGNTFSFFVTFKEPMPQTETLECSFSLVGNPKPGQEDFGTSVSCVASTTREQNQTRFYVNVPIPKGTAEGDYKLDWVTVGIGAASHVYHHDDLPSPPTVHIVSHEGLKFSAILTLEAK
jgi:hypothetical protein